MSHGRPIIPVAHDFTCPWCWIGLFQALRLRREFDVTLEWRAYELFPESLEWPQPAVSNGSDEPANRPETPSRLQLAYAAERIDPPTTPRARRVRTRNAHEAVEYAKREGTQDALVERLYRAYWEQGMNIADPSALKLLANGLISDLPEMLRAVDERRYFAEIVPFDEPAYISGVYNVPTFFIGGGRYAEQPYSVLRQAMLAAGFEARAAAYDSLVFPAPPQDRPYVFINMVATIDGKTISGTRDEHVMDLGSESDHATMRVLQEAAQAVMIGAGSLRSTPKLWYDERLLRFVVSASGEVPTNARFFTDAPAKAYVVAAAETPQSALGGLQSIRPKQGGVDLLTALKLMRTELGIQRLLVEGGSELNASLLQADLVDELFLTITPKVKLGRETPTYAGGEPLPRGSLVQFELVDERRLDDEMFLRYRRRRA